jgi:hypothetical protein
MGAIRSTHPDGTPAVACASTSSPVDRHGAAPFPSKALGRRIGRIGPDAAVATTVAPFPRQRPFSQLEWFDAGADLRRISIPVSEVLVQSD